MQGPAVALLLLLLSGLAPKPSEGGVEVGQPAEAVVRTKRVELLRLSDRFGKLLCRTAKQSACAKIGH